MTQKKAPSFEFQNQISPRYVEPIFLRLQYDRWYSYKQVATLLRSGGYEVEGSEIVRHNVIAWSHIGLGYIDKRRINDSVQNAFKLSSLGKQFIDLFSTNSGLFYDLMHFLFYSTYQRSKDIKNVRFWLYTSVCDTLWQEAPSITSSSLLANRLQVESRVTFPKYDPSFSEQSVRGVFPWLQVLAPPFLSKVNKSRLCSTRRKYCTPQLFYLATDFIYTTREGLRYGTSLSVTEQQIEDICKVCLLDTTGFWEMADLTRLSIKGFEIRRGQWGTSIALESPSAWIALPDFSSERIVEDVNDIEVDGEV